MSALDPSATSLGDLCSEALKECAVVGVGQDALAEDINGAWMRLQWMLQQWQQKRWNVYHLVDLSVVSTGADTYTIGPGGDIDTGAISTRPNRLESAFLRQLVQSQPNQIDNPLRILQAYEDFAKIALKKLVSFPGCIFLDSDWPLGKLHTYPVPQANIYAIHVIVKAQLPFKFAKLTDVFNIPFEYYEAMLTNLAMNLRAKYGKGTYPGDTLPKRASDSLRLLKGANTQIAALSMPAQLTRPGIYNIFSDRDY